MREYAATVTKVEDLLGLEGVTQVTLHIEEIYNAYTPQIAVMTLNVPTAHRKAYLALWQEGRTLPVRLPA